ncbi:MAG: glycoside hydrolase family 32 protein [Lachnospiraceae bacterium]|nr:glycoside hydrolase family 32 protein [Lachnospiraceae bacterium]MBR3683313.1 glycoside hydrolase family 32 protein [Lachnospiraceae bacterium]
MNNRPKFHFTPQKGWINDPNGTVYINGEYHLFYQHYPDDIVWGPMHWGHATSKDLLNWEHKEIALFPDELGYVFSGSCVFDKENVSGLGTKENPPLLAYFTSHHPDTGEEQQSLAYSTDYEHFTKYENNPIISNRKDSSVYKQDFRDPKVFINPIRGGFTMVLSAGAVVEFYFTKDLIYWEKSGEFYPNVYEDCGICECPDCVPLETEEGMKWVLFISFWKDNRHFMRYFVGEFDGETFVETGSVNGPLLPDFGLDNYAMVSFNNSAPLMIGWGECWEYANQTPATVYRGKMTIPRIPSLVKTKYGYRLRFTPTSEAPQKEYCLNPGEEIVFSNDCNEELKIKVTETEVIVDRIKAGDFSFSDCFDLEEFLIHRAKRFTGGTCKITVVQDEGYFEIFAEDGLLTFSVMTYPETPLNLVCHISMNSGLDA